MPTLTLQFCWEIDSRQVLPTIPSVTRDIIIIIPPQLAFLDLLLESLDPYRLLYDLHKRSHFTVAIPCLQPLYPSLDRSLSLALLPPQAHPWGLCCR